MGRARLNADFDLTFAALGEHLRERGDLEVGDEFEAALSLGAAGLRPLAEPLVKSVTHLEQNSYLATGEILFRSPGCFVLDFGVPAAGPVEFTDLKDVLPGDYVVARIVLSWLDDWRPAEERAAEEQWIGALSAPPAPPLTCRWQVRRIWLQTTPWKELFPNAFVRDWEKGRRWAEIGRTHWATDDIRHPEYFLECRLVRLPKSAGGPS